MIHGYIRVSTADQAKDGRSSLADQERRIRGIAMSHGADDCPIWKDDDISGSIPLGDRPAGKRMLAAARRGDVIVASKLDRIFRSSRDALNQAEDLHKSGIDIILIDFGTDPVMSSPCGKLFFTILAACAEFERQRIRERIGEGKAGKRARGGHAGGKAPFGWKVVGEGRTATLEVEPREQAIIEVARGMQKEGMGFNAIARALSERGHLSRAGTPFNPSQVQRWLQRIARR
jgi:DNA invertase Pin-like site-specific DNA recombinase